MKNQTVKSGKAIVHEMLDTLVENYRDVEDYRIEFNYPSIGDFILFYYDVDEYDTVYIRYEFTMPEVMELDILSTVMVSNICKAKFSSCQYAGRYCAAIHEVLIPAYSPRRDAIFKRELERLIEAVRNVRSFLDSNALYLVDQSYCELMSDIQNA